MPAIQFPPKDQLVQTIKDILRRLRALELSANDVSDREALFSYHGTVAPGTSGPYTPLVDGTLVDIRALLGTSGSTSTVVTAYLNGGSVGTVTLGAGVINNHAALGTSFTADTDILTVAVTTAGTGAANLTVEARFQ